MNDMTSVCSVQTEDCDEEFWMTEVVLKVGEPTPDFALKDDHGCVRTLKDFQGRKLILYFYPKDNTPGCTAEACSLRDHYAELQASGYAVIGVSKDGEASHRKFIEKQSLPFSLIADTECKLNEAFGVWREKKMAGRTYMGTVRTTFIIDENGVITDIIEKVDTKNHASQILKNK